MSYMPECYYKCIFFGKWNKLLKWDFTREFYKKHLVFVNPEENLGRDTIAFVYFKFLFINTLVGSIDIKNLDVLSFRYDEKSSAFIRRYIIAYRENNGDRWIRYDYYINWEEVIENITLRELENKYS